MGKCEKVESCTSIASATRSTTCGAAEVAVGETPQVAVESVVLRGKEVERRETRMV